MYVSIEQTESELLSALEALMPDIKVEAFPSAGMNAADRRAAAHPDGYAAIHFLSDTPDPRNTARGIIREFVLYIGVKGLRESGKYKGTYAAIDALRLNAPFRVGSVWQFGISNVRFVTEGKGVWWFQISLRGNMIVAM